MITVRNRKMIVPPNERHLCVEGDNNTCVREFSIIRSDYDLSGLSFFIDLLYENGEKNENIIMDPIVRDEDILLTWQIISSDVPRAGTVLIQLKAIDHSGRVKWKSYMEPFYIEQSIGTAEEYSGDLSAIEAILSRMEQIVSAENDRIASEEIRKSAELLRVEAEYARIAAENLRQASMADIEQRFHALTTEQQQDAEIIDARKGKGSLREKIDEIDSQLEKITSFPILPYEIKDGISLVVDEKIPYNNVKRYGAKGDGITDDTVAIRNVFNLYVNKTEIYFPKGVYRLTGALELPANIKNVKIYSDAFAELFFDHNGDGIVIEQSDSELGRNVFENLIISGPNPAYGALADKVSNGAGIKMIHSYHNKFINCHVSGFKYGLLFNTGIGNIFSNGTYFRFNEYGIYINGQATNMNRWVDCNIRENWRHGVHIEGPSTVNMPMYNIFDNCLIESNVPYLLEDRQNNVVPNVGVGVYIKNSIANMFTNIYFENHMRSIYMDGTSYTNQFISNRFVNNLGSLIEINGTSSKNNNFIDCIHDSSTTTSSVIINNSYWGNATNNFIRCIGFVIDKSTMVAPYPKFINCIANASDKGTVINRLNVGALHQNPGQAPSTYNPYIEGMGTSNAILHTNGYGEVQLSTLIQANTEITKFEELDSGDVFIINNYQTTPVKIKAAPDGRGNIKLKGNTDATLSGYNDTIVFYVNTLGQAVELCRNF